MAIARVQTTKGSTENNNNANISLATSNFGSNITSGNLIVVCIRGFGNTSPTITSVNDTLGNSFTLRGSKTGNNPNVWIYTAVSSSGGTDAVTVVFGNAVNTGQYLWVFAIEYNGQAATPFDATVNGNGTNQTDLTTTALTTADAGVVVSAASQDNFRTYTAGTDYTMIDGSIGTSHFGGVEEYITSAALSNYTSHMTASSAATQWTMVTVAIHAAAGGAAAISPIPQLLTLKVG